jgi:hypothetical protein
MKRRQTHAVFLDQLKRTVSSLNEMKPEDMHVITVHANYGNYEIVIGPEIPEGMGGKRHRELEINGEIHHLFISKDTITPNPSNRQIHEKLKDTVIMQDLSVHLKDPNGDGHHAIGNNGSKRGVMPRGMINMAGQRGEELVHEIEENGDLDDMTYQIIQEDILHALEKRKEGEAT